MILGCQQSVDIRVRTPWVIPAVQHTDHWSFEIIGSSRGAFGTVSAQSECDSRRSICMRINTSGSHSQQITVAMVFNCESSSLQPGFLTKLITSPLFDRALSLFSPSVRVQSFLSISLTSQYDFDHTRELHR